MLADLTRRIRCIERTQAPDGFLRPPREDGDGGGPPPSSPPSPSPPLALAAQGSRWTLGPAPLGDLSAPGGLDEGATYEIKPGLAAGAVPAADLATRWAAVQAFAAMLAIRRLDGLARDPRALEVCGSLMDASRNRLRLVKAGHQNGQFNRVTHLP
ncbi:MAG: hypothetical protein ACOYLQ_18430, partial [Hyphomicrobiaceae bacterium]